MKADNEDIKFANLIGWIVSMMVVFVAAIASLVVQSAVMFWLSPFFAALGYAVGYTLGILSPKKVVERISHNFPYHGLEKTDT